MTTAIVLGNVVLKMIELSAIFVVWKLYGRRFSAAS